MELAKPFELAPKNGDFVVLQDARSGSWEVGRWTSESSSWVQIDGKPLRIFPTHWVPVSGDAAGWENPEGLSFLVPAIQAAEPSRRPLPTRFILAFTVAAIFIGGYAAFDFGLTGAGRAKDSGFDKLLPSAAELKPEVFGERADAAVRNPVPASEQIALQVGDEDAWQAEALEAKPIADAKQRELKQALDESEARAEELARELAFVRASADKPLSERVIAQDDAVQESNAVAALAGVIPGTQSPDRPTTRTQTFSDTRSAPAAAAPGNAVEPLQPPALLPQARLPGTISPEDEARLVARAESLIKQSDFSGARLLLDYAMEKGSGRAAFMMAETYDWRMLRGVRAYGVRGDAKKAQELYELAAMAGIEKAQERLAALKSSAPPKAPDTAEQVRRLISMEKVPKKPAQRPP